LKSETTGKTIRRIDYLWRQSFSIKSKNDIWCHGTWYCIMALFY